MANLPANVQTQGQPAILTQGQPGQPQTLQERQTTEAANRLTNARRNIDTALTGDYNQPLELSYFNELLTNPLASKEERDFALFFQQRRPGGLQGQAAAGNVRQVLNQASEISQLADQAGLPFESVIDPGSVNEAVTPEGRRALAERAQRAELGRKQQEQLTGFAKEYGTAAEDFRKQLADDLSAQANELRSAYEGELGRLGEDLASSRQKTFELQNPYILEDLNRRGLLSSPTAVAQSQAQALKELQAQDEAKLAQARLGLFEGVQGFKERGADILNQFGQQAFGEGQDLYGQGLSALIGGDQAGLDAALGLRRDLLSRQFQEAQAAQERAFAESLAKKQRSNSLLNSLLGAGGAIVGGAFACFDKWTNVQMADGTEKRIDTLKLGDETLGGVVQSIRNAFIGLNDYLYEFHGVLVTGSHAVKEHGRWLRVKDAFASVIVEGTGIIYSIITSQHRVFVNGIEFADEIEHEGGQYTSMEESLNILNQEHAYATN